MLVLVLRPLFFLGLVVAGSYFLVRALTPAIKATSKAYSEASTEQKAQYRKVTYVLVRIFLFLFKDRHPAVKKAAQVERMSRDIQC